MKTIAKDVALLSVVLIGLLSRQEENVWTFSITDLRLCHLSNNFFSSTEVLFQNKNMTGQDVKHKRKEK